ncbi:MAG TPA: hypothetical protein PLE40_01985 [Candidatus Pacearchaeota archaeon]|nr:hypothetical protein [Candidatus Pacearchaeota archaeon]
MKNKKILLIFLILIIGISFLLFISFPQIKDGLAGISTIKQRISDLLSNLPRITSLSINSVPITSSTSNLEWRAGESNTISWTYNNFNSEIKTVAIYICNVNEIDCVYWSSNHKTVASGTGNASGTASTTIKVGDKMYEKALNKDPEVSPIFGTQPPFSFKLKVCPSYSFNTYNNTSVVQGGQAGICFITPSIKLLEPAVDGPVTYQNGAHAIGGNPLTDDPYVQYDLPYGISENNLRYNHYVRARLAKQVPINPDSLRPYLFSPFRSYWFGLSSNKSTSLSLNNNSASKFTFLNNKYFNYFSNFFKPVNNFIKKITNKAYAAKNIVLNVYKDGLYYGLLHNPNEDLGSYLRYSDTVLFRFGGETLEVPYWAPVKFQWRFAGNTLPDMDAYFWDNDKNAPTKQMCDPKIWDNIIKYCEEEIEKCLISCRQNPSFFNFNCDGCKKDCNKLIDDLYPDPIVILLKGIRLTKVYNENNREFSVRIAPEDHKTLYEAGVRECRYQFPSGEYDWMPTPEDPMMTMLIMGNTTGALSQFYNGFFYHDLYKDNLPKSHGEVTSDRYPTVSNTEGRSQRFVTVRGGKCERPFSYISEDLSFGKVTTITEDNFKDWASDDSFDKYYEVVEYTRDDPVTENIDESGIPKEIDDNCSFNFKNLENPLMCNSGNIDDIRIEMSCQQNTQTCGITSDSSFIKTSLSYNVNSFESSFRKYFPVDGKNKYPMDISIILLKKNANLSGDVSSYQYDGRHKLIVYGFSKRKNENTYDLFLADSNSPYFWKAKCQKKENLPFYLENNFEIIEDNSRENLTLYLCTIHEDFANRNYNLDKRYDNFLIFKINDFSVQRKETFKNYCKSLPDSKYCKDRYWDNNKQEGDISKWIEENHPRKKLSNFIVDPCEGGNCYGWTKFFLSVAYLGNFIGECPRP